MINAIFFKFIYKGEDFDQNSCFSEYEIVKTLGEGGFGKVVLGIHKLTKQKFAIKLVNSMGFNFFNIKAIS